jgi:hypothetical protein
MYGVGFGIGAIGATTKRSGGGVAYNYLLDTYSGAVVAYSLRKLSSTYTGNCIMVRRSSDNAEQNIGFVSNVLDTTSLLSFVGSSNGFVTKWYDQSGNGNDAYQNTALQQMKIVNSGALITLSGTSIPMIKNPATNGLYSFTNSVTIPSNFTNVLVYDNLANEENVGIGGPTNNTPYSVYTYYAGTKILISDGSNYVLHNADLAIKKMIGVSYRKSNTNTGVYMNGALQNTEITLTVSNGNPLYLMNRASAGINNNLTECILFNVDYSSQINTLNNTINSFYGIY